LHAYSDEHKTLPPAALYDKDGRPLLSWRVRILPYIEQGSLYKEFKLDEPWDSPHNIQLLPRMPKVFGHPKVGAEADRHATFYQVFVGPGAAFEGTTGKSFKADFPDGISSTILIVEAAEAVPWTKPVELVYEPNKPLPKLGGQFRNIFHAAFGDGRVENFLTEEPEKAIRAAITRNGNDEAKWLSRD
jgi:hypothetical protein